jgi:ribonuclease BN (tRNA processing enzyme)
VGSWGAEDLIDNAFDIHEYAPGEELDVGPLRLTFHEVPHWLPTCAVGVRSTVDGNDPHPPRFTYGADSAPTDELVRFAEGSDLLMIEATLPRPERVGVRGHLTPGEAGDHGSRAKVGRLVITHFSDEMDELWARREAERTFEGPVSVAREGSVYEV